MSLKLKLYMLICNSMVCSVYWNIFPDTLSTKPKVPFRRFLMTSFKKEKITNGFEHFPLILQDKKHLKC